MEFQKGEEVIRTDTGVLGIVVDPRAWSRYPHGDVIGVQWESGLGSNFGSQWTPVKIIRKKENG